MLYDELLTAKGNNDFFNLGVSLIGCIIMYINFVQDMISIVSNRYVSRLSSRYFILHHIKKVYFELTCFLNISLFEEILPWHNVMVGSERPPSHSGQNWFGLLNNG